MGCTGLLQIGPTLRRDIGALVIRIGFFGNEEPPK